MPLYKEGRVEKVKCYIRGNNKLPVIGNYQLIMEILKKTTDIQEIVKQIQNYIQIYLKQQKESNSLVAERLFQLEIQCLEVMTSEGWIKTKYNPQKPRLNLVTQRENRFIHTH